MFHHELHFIFAQIRKCITRHCNLHSEERRRRISNSSYKEEFELSSSDQSHSKALDVTKFLSPLSVKEYKE